MIMGNKIVKVEDAFITLGGYILSILQKQNMNTDNLYIKFKEVYPKKNIDFNHFIYTLDFLFMINKIDIKKDDILEVKI